MKRHILLSLSVLISIFSHGQTNFKWDIVIDSLEENQSQLYSKTKLFIGETWRSSQDVIQNDDAAAGVILVKGLSVQNLFYQMNDHRWTYAYSIKFMVKDKKCRIVIDNVYCDAARCATYEWPHMPVADVYPTEKGLKLTGVNEERYLELMTKLKSELQMVVDSYSAYIKNPIANTEDW